MSGSEIAYFGMNPWLSFLGAKFIKQEQTGVCRSSTLIEVISLPCLGWLHVQHRKTSDSFNRQYLILLDLLRALFLLYYLPNAVCNSLGILSDSFSSPAFNKSCECSRILEMSAGSYQEHFILLLTWYIYHLSRQGSSISEQRYTSFPPPKKEYVIKQGLPCKYPSV